jgi:hypothetical protein
MNFIDFAPGLHGHFLSYVVNQYIFNIGVKPFDIFQSSGAAHLINLNKEFISRQQVFQGHASYFNYDYPAGTDKIVWIKHSSEFDFVLLTNIFNRCHPDVVNSEIGNSVDINKLHLDNMFSSQSSLHELRENWYTKLLENHLVKGAVLKQTNIPVFEFDVSSFFDLSDFIEELSRCADFLNMKLHFNSDLVDLHTKFLHKNQGYQRWNICKSLINDIISNKKTAIDLQDWQIQAFINFKLSQLFKIYSGALFDQDLYAKDTQEIHGMVRQFLNTYDQYY